MSETKFASAGYDGTVHRFLLRVALEAARDGKVRRYDLAPEAWQALAHETSFASCPGSRFSEEMELRTCTGWVIVRCNVDLAANTGVALLGEGEAARQAALDFVAVT